MRLIKKIAIGASILFSILFTIGFTNFVITVSTYGIFTLTPLIGLILLNGLVPGILWLIVLITKPELPNSIPKSINDSKNLVTKEAIKPQLHSEAKVVKDTIYIDPEERELIQNIIIQEEHFKKVMEKKELISNSYRNGLIDNVKFASEGIRIEKELDEIKGKTKGLKLRFGAIKFLGQKLMELEKLQVNFILTPEEVVLKREELILEHCKNMDSSSHLIKDMRDIEFM